MEKLMIRIIMIYIDMLSWEGKGRYGSFH